MVDREYPGRVLIAEANQWPQRGRRVLRHRRGAGVPHGLRLPGHAAHLLLAALAARRASCVRVLAETTEVPEGAAWGVFLRNHDELTLEMVSEEYRQAMYGWYAYDPRMRSNVGIRRRLAPLLDNSRAELELAHALLFSPAGQPVPVLRRRDRHGRQHLAARPRLARARPCSGRPTATPGFSTADPGKLYLPVVQSLVYNYTLDQRRSRSSRSRGRCCTGSATSSTCARRTRPSGSGTLRVLETNHESVLAFVREYEGTGHRSSATRPRRCCACSASPTTPCRSTIDAPGLRGRRRLATSSAAASSRPSATTARSTLTLGTQSFYWLHLGERTSRASARAAGASCRRCRTRRRTLYCMNNWGRTSRVFDLETTGVDVDTAAS